MIGISVTILKTCPTKVCDKGINTSSCTPIYSALAHSNSLSSRLKQTRSSKKDFYENFEKKIRILNRLNKKQAKAERNENSRQENIKRVTSLRKLRNSDFQFSRKPTKNFEVIKPASRPIVPIHGKPKKNPIIRKNPISLTSLKLLPNTIKVPKNPSIAHFESYSWTKPKYSITEI